MPSNFNLFYIAVSPCHVILRDISPGEYYIQVDQLSTLQNLSPEEHYMEVDDLYPAHEDTLDSARRYLKIKNKKSIISNYINTNSFLYKLASRGKGW